MYAEPRKVFDTWLKKLLIHDLYVALPELNPSSKMQDDEPAESQPLSSKDEKEVKRKKRGIGAMFTSVLPGLIPWLWKV